jgi:dihydroorotate dehydrogenase electron transfer subunit
MPMMKTVFKIAKEKNIMGFASLEEKMACGIGNCQGCAVKISGQNKMTCKDGPVFKIEEIEL